METRNEKEDLKMVRKIMVAVLIEIMAGGFLSSAGSVECDAYGNGTRRQAITADPITMDTSGQDHSACGLSYPVRLNSRDINFAEDDRVSDENYLDETPVPEEPAEKTKPIRWLGWIAAGVIFVGFILFEMRQAECRMKNWKR